MNAVRQLAFAIRIAIQRPRQLRHFARWQWSLTPDSLLATGTPWITYDATDDLAARLTPGCRVFEYGSGGSTLFWLRHGAQVVSVEHDPRWYTRLAPLVAGENCDYRLVEPEATDTDSLLHGEYRSADPGFADQHFHQYVTQIDAFPDESFAIVLVDGRSRGACLRHAARKVARGGVLVLDNAERRYYLAGQDDLLASFAHQRYHGVGPGLNWMWETAIYVRR